jgi:hypothetical protein
MINMHVRDPEQECLVFGGLTDPHTREMQLLRPLGLLRSALPAHESRSLMYLKIIDGPFSSQFRRTQLQSADKDLFRLCDLQPL